MAETQLRRLAELGEMASCYWFGVVVYGVYSKYPTALTAQYMSPVATSIIYAFSPLARIPSLCLLVWTSIYMSHFFSLYIMMRQNA